MVVFEVLQASIHSWVCDEKRGGSKNAIYMDIYPQQLKKSCRCFGQKQKTTSKTKLGMRCSTGLTDEEQEMQFRKYTDDGILCALAVLGGSKLRARKGDPIHLCADVFRIRSERGDCDELEIDTSDAKKVCTLMGVFRAGFWEPAVLHPVGVNASSYSSEDSASEASELHAVLELRPVSSRPFLLKYAKPAEHDSSIEAYYHQGVVGMSPSKRRGSATDGSQPHARQRRGSLSQTKPMMVPTFDPNLKKKKEKFHLASFLSAESRKWNSENARTRFMEWRPGADSEWQKLWSNIWPERGDNLYGKTEVVPLMETEFRRDCIVFFNTIFPRSGKKTFWLLRDTVLDPNSKAPFKPLPSKMEPGASIAHTNAGCLREVLWSSAEERAPAFLGAVQHNSSYDLARQVSDQNDDEGAPMTKALSDSLMELYGGYNAAILQEDRISVPSTAVSRRDPAVPARRKARSFSGQVIPCCGDCGIVFPEHMDAEYNTNESYRITDSDSEDEAPLILGSPEYMRTRMNGTREVHMCLQDPFVADSEDVPSPKSSPYHSSPCHSHSLGAQMRGANHITVDSLFLQQHPQSPTPSSQDQASGSASGSVGLYGKWREEAGDREESRIHGSRISTSPMIVVPEEVDTKEANNSYSSSKETPVLSRSASRSNFWGPVNSNAISSVTSIGRPFSASRGTGTGRRTGGLRCISSKSGCDFLDEYSPRIALLKRLFVCFAHCGVHYSEVVESSQIGDPWPYPLASVLGHGCRVLIRLEDVEGSEFMNFLLTGDPAAMDWKVTGVPPPLKPRIAATHSVSIETETGRIFERKLHVTSAADGVQNFRDGLKKKHLGLDMPIGGVGNPSPMGRNFSIGFRGDAYQVDKVAKNGWNHPRSNSWSRISLTKLSDMASITGEGEALTCRVVPDVQGGHLYIRIDDFGDQIANSSWAEHDEGDYKKQSMRKTWEEMRNSLEEKIPEPELPIKMLEMVRKVGAHKNAAGELLLLTKSERACKRKWHYRPSTHGRHAAGDMTMVRMSSEPTLHHDTRATSIEDNAWLHYVVLAKSNEKETLQSPPSSTALRLLFEHYSPLHAEIYGNSPFKSFDDLFHELKDEKSFLVKSMNGIQRYVEPTIVQLCWKHDVLILRYEVPPGKEPVEKNTFIATRTNPNEDWYEATLRAVSAELNIQSNDEVFDQLSRDDEKCLSVMKETTFSPSYPGLNCLYKTHMVLFQIQDGNDDAWRRLGILDAEKTAAADRLGCDFVTVKDSPAGQKQLFWKWVPRNEAQQMQKFLNMSEATQDERWAKYAYQANGLVRYPPSDHALAILLRRCGIDIGKFGTGSYKQVRDFWLELTNEESFLQMTNGRPVRVAEATFVRLQWKPMLENGVEPSGDREKQMPWKVLVQVREERPDGKVSERKKLLSTRKGKEESWEDSAMRCVVQDLCITKQQLKGLLARKTNSLAGYLFFEEKLKETISYPGIQGSYRTHLVTFTLKADLASCANQEPTKTRIKRSGSAASLNSHTRPSTSANTSLATRSSSFETAEVVQADSKVVKTKRETPQGVKTINFEWISEDKLNAHDCKVKGVDLWAKAGTRKKSRRISSVLMGLEGSGPGMKSPFGGTHDASGKSKPTSAIGNHKWKAFRLNNALQVPSDENGMRMRITRETFSDLQEICRKIDILDPGLELLYQAGQPRERSYLDQCFAEREFFKHILSSNALHAKEVLRCYLEYRESHPTMSCRVSRVSGRVDVNF